MMTKTIAFKISNHKNDEKIAINWKKLKKIAQIILFGSSVLLNILAIFRISWFGQALDDIFHRLLFGWLKYLWFAFIIIWYFGIITKKYLISQYWFKINKMKLLWFLINIFWTFGLIGMIVINADKSQTLSYDGYRLDKIVPEYVQIWKKYYVLDNTINSAKDFFQWNGAFSGLYDGGGLIGKIIAGSSTYLHVITAIIINFVSWIFWICYLIFNHPFYLLLSTEKRRKYFWNRFNNKKDNYFQASSITKIDKKEITIQVPIEKKNNNQKEQKIKEEEWDLEDD